MISNLALLLRAIAKTAWMTGLGPGIALVFFGPKASKYFRPVRLGKAYHIVGHYLGEFIGEICEVRRDSAIVRVTDPMRAKPRVRDKCCYPECVREDFHFGDHEFVRVREDATIEVCWTSAKFEPVEERARTA